MEDLRLYEDGNEINVNGRYNLLELQYLYSNNPTNNFIPYDLCNNFLVILINSFILAIRELV